MELKWETIEWLLGCAMTTLEMEVDGEDLDDSGARERIERCGEIAEVLKISGGDRHWREMIAQLNDFVQDQECSNCGMTWSKHQLKDIQNYNDRVSPGEIVPSGECPECGALCHPVTPPEPSLAMLSSRKP
ncbi:hypothetical protein [Edaphobacter dinghuensis]|uniref:Uncharacterized protein n=1 Tax=Edaphobacter dinghuensis TaxID=1560005 RepID=A0A917HQZ3_9BACT|nr:hypothetical protein [Edaphobacter dinghuensis]GGG86674.1 hypothetical protein GCM10011585_33310 [Edaphobacter dinghuensis]